MQNLKNPFLCVIFYFFALTFFLICAVGRLGTAATTGLLYQHRMIGEGDCGEIGGMKIVRGDRSTYLLTELSPS
jgi:hypothetical protein